MRLTVVLVATLYSLAAFASGRSCPSLDISSTFESSAYVFIADVDHKIYPENMDSRLSPSMRRILSPAFKKDESLTINVHNNIKGTVPKKLTGNNDFSLEYCSLDNTTKYIIFSKTLKEELTLSHQNTIEVGIVQLMTLCSIIHQDVSVEETEACIRKYL